MGLLVSLIVAAGVGGVVAQQKWKLYLARLKSFHLAGPSQSLLQGGLETRAVNSVGIGLELLVLRRGRCAAALLL